MVSTGCRCGWSCHSMISNTFLIGDRSGNLADQGKISTLCRAHCVKTAVLNNQTDVQASSQCVWDNHKSAPAIKGNCSPDHDSRSRSSESRPQTVWFQAPPGLLLTDTRPSNSHQGRTCFHQKIQQISTPSSNEHTTGVANGNGLDSVE
ncbi:uncharacterized protein TNCV_1511581 [Trichonephila clavipes]|nr:uncharacterized protein TNCV_1511581 [Trichonephila clavipes]